MHVVFIFGKARLTLLRILDLLAMALWKDTSVLEQKNMSKDINGVDHDSLLGRSVLQVVE